LFKENFDENFEEVLVTDAPIEDLLDEHFLVGVFELHKLAWGNLL